jgi:hypothetical protein
MRPELYGYHLGANVIAFSTTRKGGCSEGNYAEMNINAYCGDLPEAVERNRALLAQELGVATSRLFLPHQVHGDVVRLIDEDFLSLSMQEQQDALEGVDALMTCQKNVCIGVSTADCIPIVIYDPQRKCSAVVHAGWRGTVKHIVQAAITGMQTAFQCSPTQLHAVIGPGISLKNFEVGVEVYEQFQGDAVYSQPIAQLMPANGGREQYKWHIDLPLCNRLQMERLGVLARQITDCGICTYDHADRFFSARRLGIQSGRIFTGIVLL